MALKFGDTLHPSVELVLELGLVVSHRLALSTAIPAFAARLGALLREHGVSAGEVWTGGSTQRISAVVGVAAETRVELLTAILPAFLENFFKPQFQLQNSRQRTKQSSLVRSLTARLGTTSLPICIGKITAVDSVCGLGAEQRIAWQHDGNYRATLRALGIELDVNERVEDLVREFTQQSSPAWSSFVPPALVLKAWVVDVESVRVQRLPVAVEGDAAELPAELVAELAAKHRCLAVASELTTPGLEVLVVAQTDEQSQAHVSALADDLRLVASLWTELSSAVPVAPPLTDGALPELCRVLSLRLGLSAETYRMSLQAAPHLVSGQTTHLVSTFPELARIVCCELARRLNAPEDTLKVLRALDHAGMIAGALPVHTEAAALLLLADNLSVLMRAAASGALPAGPVDPHRARPRAVGLLKTLLEREWDIAVAVMVETAASISSADLSYGVKGAEERLVGFLRHRMRGLLDAAAPGAVAVLGFEGVLDSPVHRARHLRSRG